MCLRHRLTIDRGEWLTGKALVHLQDSGLCDKQTHLKCCLGFYGRELGATETDLMGWSTLTSFARTNFGTIGQSYEWLNNRLDEQDKKRFNRPPKSFASTVEDALIAVNDGSYHPIRKEAAIKYLFAKYGAIQVEFTGRYADATAKAKKAA